MARQTSSQTLKLIAGSVLAGAGLLVLRGTVEEAAQLSQLRGSMPGDGLGLWHFVMLAASLNRHQVVQGALEIFVALWPLFAVMAGAGLLWNAYKEKSEGCHRGSCRLAHVNESLVFWRRCTPFGSGASLPEHKAVAR
jgi:hypothetical protein